MTADDLRPYGRQRRLDKVMLTINGKFSGRESVNITCYVGPKMSIRIRRLLRELGDGNKRSK